MGPICFYSREVLLDRHSLARSSAQVSRSHHSLDSRLSLRGFLIKPTVNQKDNPLNSVPLELGELGIVFILDFHILEWDRK